MANKIFCAITKVIGRGAADDYLIDMCVRTALYYEDICSDIGIWQTFKKLDIELFGSTIPFEIGEGESIEKDLTLGGVQFVMWLSLSTKREAVVNPNSEFLQNSAKIAYEILLNENRRQAINPALQKFVYNNGFNDLYAIRKVLSWLTIDCCLSKCDRIDEQLDARIDSFCDFMDEEPAIYAAMSEIPFIVGCTPLSLPCQDFYASLLARHGNTAAASEIRKIEYRKRDIWKNEPITETTSNLTNSDGQTILVDFSRFPDGLNLKSRNAPGIYAAFIKYKGLWELNGTMMASSKKICDEWERYKENVNYSKKKSKEIIEKYNGQPLFFFKSFDEATAWVAKELGSTKDTKIINEVFGDSGKFMVFVSEKAGIGIVNDGDYIEAIADENNPFYIEGDNENIVTAFKNTQAITDECLLDLLENDLIPGAMYKDSLDPERGRRIVQKNKFFMYSCYRRALM